MQNTTTHFPFLQRTSIRTKVTLLAPQMYTYDEVLVHYPLATTPDLSMPMLTIHNTLWFDIEPVIPPFDRSWILALVTFGNLNVGSSKSCLRRLNVDLYLRPSDQHRWNLPFVPYDHASTSIFPLFQSYCQVSALCNDSTIFYSPGRLSL